VHDDRSGLGGREDAEVDRRSIGKEIPLRCLSSCLGTQLRGNGVARVHVRD